MEMKGMSTTKEMLVGEMDFIDIIAKKHSTIRVIGANELILISAESLGRKFEKLINVKQLKNKTPDESMEKAHGKVMESIKKWVLEKEAILTGNDFEKHGIKQNQRMNGMSLTDYFEYMLETEED